MDAARQGIDPMTEKKLNDIVTVDFVTVNATGVPATPNEFKYFVYIGSGVNPMAGAPAVGTSQRKDETDTLIVGAYVASFGVMAPMAIGSGYSVLAMVRFGGTWFPIPLIDFVVRQFSIDDVVSAMNALIAADANSGNGTVFVGDPIEIIQGDDYLPSTRQLSFDLVGGPELSAPAVPVFMGVGEKTSSKASYWTSAQGTATRIDGTTQRLTFSAGRDKTSLQPAPRELGYSIEARFGANADEWTVWRGVVNSTRKHAD